MTELLTRNLNRKRWWVRFEAYYQRITCRLDYKRLRARDSIVWSGQLAQGVKR